VACAVGQTHKKIECLWNKGYSLIKQLCLMAEMVASQGLKIFMRLPYACAGGKGASGIE
jgi:hypothetical protein